MIRQYLKNMIKLVKRYYKDNKMNIDRMINMLLIKLSKRHYVFYMEKRTYREDKINKSYYVKIDNYKKEFRNKTDLLIYLSNIKE